VAARGPGFAGSAAGNERSGGDTRSNGAIGCAWIGAIASRPLRESALIYCHLRLTISLFLTADTGRLTQINADELD